MTTQRLDADDSMSRRNFLLTATIGGVTVAATAIGGAAIGNTLSRSEAQVELAKLRTLITLYESLDRVNVDALIAASINGTRGAFEALKTGAQILRAGIINLETALRNFQGVLDNLFNALREIANGIANLLANLTQKFKAAEGPIVAVIGATLPLAEAIANFFNTLLSKIPFGVGEEIRRALNALVDLVRAIPSTVDAVANQIKPLRETLLPANGDSLVKANVGDPLARFLIDPLKKFLTDAEALADQWEREFVKPGLAALDERAKIRKQIAQFKQENNLS